MSDQLAGLFGSGADAEGAMSKANDFVSKVTSGAADLDPDEATGYLNQVIGKADSAQMQAATKEALNNLTPDQQKEFGAFVDQLKQRDPSAPDAGTYDVDNISKMFGDAGGSASSVDDLLGGLLGGLTGGGTGGATSPSTSSSGGIGGMISGLLGSLTGGSKPATSAAGATDGGVDIGSLLNSPIGKTVMAGVTAYLMKNMMGGKN